MSKVNVVQNWYNKGRGVSLLLLSVVFLIYGSAAHALCVFENDERVQMYMSPETHSWGTYDGKQLVTASKAFKCQQDVGRYLMITLGSVKWGTSTDAKKNYIFDSYNPGVCSLENSKTNISLDSARSKESFSKQYNFLRSCIDIRVVDLGGEPLIAKEQQKYCQVEKGVDGQYVLHGDMCFIKIRSANQFMIQPVLNPKCLDPAYLDSLGIEAQDMFANLNVLVAGDDSGISTDVQHIGSRPIQINISPSSKLLRLSEDLGRGTPQFITDYNVDSDWGNVHIETERESTEINLSFFVSNLIQKKCLNGSCSSTSNYMQPFFGQIELFKMYKNRNPELIEEWWDGGLIPPNWQGFAKGIGYRSPDNLFKNGGKYRIVATFQNPTDDYAIFLNGLKQMLIHRFEVEGSTVGIDNIPGLTTLGQLGVVPTLNGVPGLGGNNQQVDLEETI
ncbi:MAG: hypothetical protein KUL82_12410, partial [Bdellovibrio sp.]|nr:hypothetical protein [Bdellovibrio sp.]